MGLAFFLGQWQWREKGWKQPQKVQWGRKESRRTSETSLETWHDGAQRGSLWLCYAGSLTVKQKSEISGKRHKPKPIFLLDSLGEKQFEKLGEKEDREGEPAIERRREYAVFGFILGEREEQVVCYASALALVMTDEAR